MCDFANGIVLFRRALPFCPSERQVIYVESDYEKDVNDFIEALKKEKPELNIWCYSGYTFEELKNRKDEITDITLNNIDVLVDGRYVESRKNPEIRFRGSDNQRIIDLRKTLNENKIVELDV